MNDMTNYLTTKKSITGRSTCFYSSIFFCESGSKRRWKGNFALTITRKA